MNKCTIRRSDAAEKDRHWQGGNYAVRNEKGTVALFMFDYPECRSPVCANNEAEALVAAKSFMVIGDLIGSLVGLTSIIENAGLLNLSKGVELGQVSWFVKAADCMAYAKETLEKAGIKRPAHYA